jgi:hypothetical protein
VRKTAGAIFTLRPRLPSPAGSAGVPFMTVTDGAANGWKTDLHVVPVLAAVSGQRYGAMRAIRLTLDLRLEMYPTCSAFVWRLANSLSHGLAKTIVRGAQRRD